MKQVIFIFLLIFAFIPLAETGISARAEAKEYSGVLEDMQKDAAFNYSDYLYNDRDCSLQLIHLAESTDKELFVYIYQPSGDSAEIMASSINVSKGYKTLKFRNYKLRYISSYGVLYKYAVEDFEIEDADMRFYDILTIYRNWDERIDKNPANDNVVNEVPYKVGKIYAIGETGDEQVIEVKDTDTVAVVSKYVGFVRYNDGFRLFGPTACDSHFIAFSTDKRIDKLQEADVYYVEQSCETNNDLINALLGLSEKFGDKKEKYSYVTDKQEIEYETKGLFNVGKICRDRISAVEEFIKNEDFKNVYACGIFNVSTSSSIDEKGKEYLRECEWVVRFAETEYSLISSGGIQSPVITIEERTIISDVSLLRLEFETDGITYNLGVIDNKQTGGDEPINDWKVDIKGLNAIAVAIAVGIAVLGVVFAVLLVKTLCKKDS